VDAVCRHRQEELHGRGNVGGLASYVELLTCLEMARDVAGWNADPKDPHPNSGSRPTQAGRPDVTVGEAHRR
jgi:hypothetical protein